MKNTLVSVILGVILFALFFWLGGCTFEQLGETKAEGSRRHERVFRVDGQEMMGDIDRAMLLDKPSRTTDKRIP
jgi:hypothetical protein